MSRADRPQHLAEFYGLMGELERRLGGARRLGACTGRDGWPRCGVYFFFEPGELRGNGAARIVRIGTHAVSDSSKSTLWGRLSSHKGRAKSRAATTGGQSSAC